MTAFVALYDPSQPSPDGSFWRWRSPNLDRRLLDRLYYDIAAANRPQDPRLLNELTVVGGFAQLTPQWTCVYRFGNGGRDAHGRPGRCIMLAAFVARDQTDGVDLSPLLSCGIFREALAQAPRTCPLPAPPALEIEFAAELRRADPALVEEVLRNGRLELSGPNAIADAAAVCAHLPADRGWSCRVGGAVAAIACPASAPAPISQLRPARTGKPLRPKAIGRAREAEARSLFGSGQRPWTLRRTAMATGVVIGVAGILWAINSAGMRAQHPASQPGDATQFVTQPARSGRPVDQPLRHPPTTRRETGP